MLPPLPLLWGTLLSLPAKASQPSAVAKGPGAPPGGKGGNETAVPRAPRLSMVTQDQEQKERTAVERKTPHAQACAPSHGVWAEGAEDDLHRMTPRPVLH